MQFCPIWRGPSRKTTTSRRILWLIVAVIFVAILPVENLASAQSDLVANGTLNYSGPRPARMTVSLASADKRPLIRKLGTIDLDMVETTPVVWHGQVWRFEWVRPGTHDQAGLPGCFRFINPKTGAVTPSFAKGYQFGSAFVENGTAYVTGTTDARHYLAMFVSKDLKTWEERTVINDPKYGIFNNSLCKAGDEYMLAFEIDRPAEEAGAPFTIRFAKSRDLRKWTITPPECVFTKDRYSAAPCLRWSEGWYYLFYLENYNGYETRLVRSRDLIHWEASPLNPVLRASPEDKAIANPELSEKQRAAIARGVDVNNSDLDFCQWHGKVIMNYSWGDQIGAEFLSEATYDGTQDQFLRAWFPQR
jgi:alpha-L-fucosidase